MYQTSKPKSVGKIALPRSKAISRRVLETLRKTAEIVGSTLGPFGQAVLLERPETNLKPIVTKDGVTVFKHIGYEDAVEQVVLEAARDAVVRTAQEAGDGTTTATILSYAIAKHASEVTEKNRRFSPQRVVRAINALVPLLEDEIKKMSITVDGNNYDDILHKVATLSANGDSEMAGVIMSAFDMVGEEGNITISEEYGLPGYDLKKFEGFTIEKGYEESCENFYSSFINDPSNSRIYIEKPIFFLFDGNLNEPNTIISSAQFIHSHFEQNPDAAPKNIVLVAHSFTKAFLQWAAVNFVHGQIKVIPVKCPQTIVQNSQSHFLHDVAAFTNGVVFNPLSKPIQQATLDELIRGKSDAFEAGRYRSTIIGSPDISAVEFRVSELKRAMENPESSYDKQELEVRTAKLTCGIAKIKVVGPSQVEIREKKDRAEDAWCAIRSSSRLGALPGGCWTLVQLSKKLAEWEILFKLESPDKAVAASILKAAFLKPVEVLYSNAGYELSEIEDIVHQMMEKNHLTFDLQEGKWVNRTEILDSTAAVLEAIRNSISISTMLGTLGGLVVFKRDSSIDSKDSMDLQDFLKSVEAGEDDGTSEE
jgi:chaperonin GroEL